MRKAYIKFKCNYKNENFVTECDVVDAGTLSNPDYVQVWTIYDCPICSLGLCDNSQCNLHTQGAPKIFYSRE